MNFRNQSQNQASSSQKNHTGGRKVVEPPKPASVSDHRISLDEVYESLEDYKEVINNVYGLNTVLDEYSSQIQLNQATR